MRSISDSRAQEVAADLAACQQQADALELEYRALMTHARHLKQQRAATARAIRRHFATLRRAQTPIGMP